VPVLTAERLNGAACVASRADPVAVAVDTHDEERMLLIAMRALARDPDLRRRLGVAAPDGRTTSGWNMPSKTTNG